MGRYFEPGVEEITETDRLKRFVEEYAAGGDVDDPDLYASVQPPQSSNPFDEPPKFVAKVCIPPTWE